MLILFSNSLITALSFIIFFLLLASGLCSFFSSLGLIFNVLKSALNHKVKQKVHLVSH